MSAAEFFAGVDQDAAEEAAVRLASVFVAAVELGRPTHDDADLAAFEAGTVKALVTCLATWIVHDHQDEEQHEEAFDGVIALLRREYTSLQARG